MNIKKIFNAIQKYISNSNYRFNINSEFGFYNHMPDKEYLEKKYESVMYRKLDLKNPKTFNEKLQWLKLYNHRPEYTMMVDKYKVRKYVAEKLGEEYLIPCLGVWKDPKDIPFDKLPEQFVLKCNHNSGLGMCICKDKSKININKVKKELKKGLYEDYYLTNREWPYKNVERCIVCEKYMSNKDGTELNDYKYMCFNGKVKCSFVCSNRFSKNGLNVTFFDNDWNLLPFERHYPKSPSVIPRPFNHKKMIELSEILSKDIPFVRIDFYEINGRIYFGEMTFFPGSGLEEFIPSEWDDILGSYIELPNKYI